MTDFSFIVPIYNDADLAADFCAAFETVMKGVGGTFELIFVSDGSRAEEFEKLEKTTAGFSYVRLIELSRNFGQHIAVSAGYEAALGKLVGMLNVDMEDHPDQIPILLDAMKRESWDFVCGLYDRRNVSMGRRITSAGFNLAMNWIAGHEIPLGAATLRIMNRQFLDSYLRFTEKSRYLPGLECWLGFRRGFVTIRHRPRVRGKSSYNFVRRLRFAVDSIITFSDYPLRVASTVGAGIAIAGFAMTGWLVFNKFWRVDYLPGYPSTVAIITLLGGLQILFTGLGSLYIGRVLKEVQNRPLYVIRRKVNFDGV